MLQSHPDTVYSGILTGGAFALRHSSSYSELLPLLVSSEYFIPCKHKAASNYCQIVGRNQDKPVEQLSTYNPVSHNTLEIFQGRHLEVGF